MMSNIFNLRLIQEYISCGCWDEYVNGGNLYLSSEIFITTRYPNRETWFEVYHLDSWEGCYLFSTQDLKEVFDWCYDNLNLDILYY